MKRLFLPPRALALLAAALALSVASGSVASADVEPAVTGDIVEFALAANVAPEGITAGPDGNLWFVENAASKIGKITPAGQLTEFPLAQFSGPNVITSGRDGNLWFGENNNIGRITPAGAITLFPIPGGGIPGGIAAGPDGNLWFTETFRGAIGEITPAAPNTVTLYSIPTRPGGGSSNPAGIVAGPDANLWFTESNSGASKIGVVSTSGVFLHEYATPTAASKPMGIAVGPDGNLWFTESDPASNRIGKVTAAGAFTEYPVPTANAAPLSIMTGSDGRLWFAESNSSASKIGVVDTSGVFAEFATPTTLSSPYGLALGSDGNLWFTEKAKSKVGRAADVQKKTSYVLALPSGFAPATRSSTAGNAVQWSFTGPVPATVTDMSGMALFDSGPKPASSAFSYTFVGAGTYPYRDTIGSRNGTVAVPMKVAPATGDVTTPFAVTWASATAPAGFVYDVQVKRPGSTTFADWQVGVTGKNGTFVPDAGAGAYAFHGRLRKLADGSASGFSAPKSITVS